MVPFHQSAKSMMGLDLVHGAKYLPIQYIVYTLAGTYDEDLEDYMSRSFGIIKLGMNTTIRGLIQILP